MAPKQGDVQDSVPADGGQHDGLEVLCSHLESQSPTDEQLDGDAPVADALARGLSLDACLDSVGETAETLIAETFDALANGEIDAEEAEQFLQSEMSSLTAELREGIEDTDRISSAESSRTTPVALVDSRELVDALPVPAFLLDDEHTMVAYNYGTARLLGIEQTKELGNDYRDVVARAVYADGRREMSLADKVVEAPCRAHEEYDVDRVDDERIYTDHYVYEDTSTMLNQRGEEIPIAFIATPIFDDVGNLLGVLELFEERETDLERFPGLAGVISHDIRNPLDVLNTYITLLEDDIDDEYYEHIDRNLDRIEAIIDDVMTFSKQADSEQEPTTLELESIASGVWDDVETADATLETESVTVEGDRAMVERLLENLFENAVTHGGNDVTVRIGPADGGFYVEDDGPGIPEERRSSIFQHGYTTDATGTGFGLSIVHKIAERHGWTVDVTEGEDGGARFEITETNGETAAYTSP